MAGTVFDELPKKLGIRDGQTVVLLNAPTQFERSVTRGSAAADVRVTRHLRPTADVVVLFVSKLEELERRLPVISERMHPHGGLWVAWRSRRSIDVSSDVVKRVCLAAGMVDNKSCELDDVWSGMRLVIRDENRDALAYRITSTEAPRRTRASTVSRLVGAGSSQRRLRARTAR